MSAEERAKDGDWSDVRPVERARVQAEVLSEQLDATRVLQMDEIGNIRRAAEAAARKEQEYKKASGNQEITRVMQSPMEAESGQADGIGSISDDTEDLDIPKGELEAGDVVVPDEETSVDPMVGKVLEIQRPAPKPTGDAEQDHLAKIKHIYEKTSEIYQRRLGKQQPPQGS